MVTEPLPHPVMTIAAHIATSTEDTPNAPAPTRLRAAFLHLPIEAPDMPPSVIV